jgi:SAM-dependent methyltransferase
MLTNLNLSDMETCYKMFRREVVEHLVIEEDRFGMEPEITAKVAAAGWRVYEVGISYRGRTYEQGKKIGWKDGMRAMYCMLVRYAPWWSGLRRRRARLRAIERTAAETELLESLDSLDNAHNYSEWILELIRPYLGNSVLEVGAGHGTFTRLLADHLTVTALEPSPLALPRLREAVGERSSVRIVEGDLYEVGPNVRTDSAIFLNVLEHIEDDHEALRQVGHILGLDGTVVVLAPALELLYSRFDAAVGHHRRYRRRELSALLDQTGFEVVECRYVNAPGAVAWLLYAKMLGRTPTRSGPALAYDRLMVPILRRLERRWTPPLGQSILAVGRYRADREEIVSVPATSSGVSAHV